MEIILCRVPFSVNEILVVNLILSFTLKINILTCCFFSSSFSVTHCSFFSILIFPSQCNKFTSEAVPRYSLDCQPAVPALSDRRTGKLLYV